MGVAQPKLRSRKDGAAVPLDDTDKRLMNLLQSSFPLDPRAVRPIAARGRARAWTTSMARTQRLLDERIIREITPIFDTRALGYELDARRGQGRLRAPAPRGEDHQLASRRLAQLPAHPRVQPLVHDRDPARLRARARGHARGAPAADRRRVDPPAADADAVQDQHEPGDGEGHRGARGGRRGGAAARARAPALRRHRHRRDPRAPGADGGHRPALRRRRRRGRDDAPSDFLAHLAAMVERKILRRVAAILFHRRAGFSANGMGVWRVPEEKILETGGADGGRPRDLALLPAADLRRLALLGLHHGPRALEGGVRRDPRLDRRRARPARRRPRRPLLVDRVQEDPAALLHRRLRRAGRRSTRRLDGHGRLEAPHASAPRRWHARPDARRGQLAGARDEGRSAASTDLRRARRGLRAGRRRRQPLRRLGLLVGAADPRPRRHPACVEAVAAAAGAGTSFGAPTEAEVELAAGGRASASSRSRWCGWSARAPRRR